MEKINNSIDSLESNFKNKITDFLKEVRIKYPNVGIFEAMRSLDRQKELYSIGRRGIAGEKPVTWTMQSNHLKGLAVDIVFMDNSTPTWSGDYPYLIEVAKKYGINNLAPKELCHFECDGTKYKHMGPYEAMFTKKYGSNGTIYNNLEPLDELISKGDIKEIVYLLLIGMERIKKTP